MVEERVTRLEATIDANHRSYEERFERVCNNQRILSEQVQQLLGLFRGIKKAIWGAGALAGTVGGVFFEYFPEFVRFLDKILNAV